MWAEGEQGRKTPVRSSGMPVWIGITGEDVDGRGGYVVLTSSCPQVDVLD